MTQKANVRHICLSCPDPAESAGLPLLCCRFLLCPRRSALSVTMQRVISRCAAAAAAVDPHRPGSKRIHLKTAHFACTTRTANNGIVMIPLKVTPSKKSIPALLTRHGERNCGAESLRSACSPLTMAIATGSMHGWGRCAAQMYSSAPRPGLSVVQHQHQHQQLKQQQQQRSSPPSLSVFLVPSLIFHTA